MISYHLSVIDTILSPQEQEAILGTTALWITGTAIQERLINSLEQPFGRLIMIFLNPLQKVKIQIEEFLASIRQRKFPYTCAQECRRGGQKAGCGTHGEEYFWCYTSKTGSEYGYCSPRCHFQLSYSQAILHLAKGIF